MVARHVHRRVNYEVVERVDGGDEAHDAKVDLGGRLRELPGALVREVERGGCKKQKRDAIQDHLFFEVGALFGKGEAGGAAGRGLRRVTGGNTPQRGERGGARMGRGMENDAAWDRRSVTSTAPQY